MRRTRLHVPMLTALIFVLISAAIVRALLQKGSLVRNGGAMRFPHN